MITKHRTESLEQMRKTLKYSLISLALLALTQTSWGEESHEYTSVIIKRKSQTSAASLTLSALSQASSRLPDELSQRAQDILGQVCNVRPLFQKQQAQTGQGPLSALGVNALSQNIEQQELCRIQADCHQSAQKLLAELSQDPTLEVQPDYLMYTSGSKIKRFFRDAFRSGPESPKTDELEPAPETPAQPETPDAPEDSEDNNANDPQPDNSPDDSQEGNQPEPDDAPEDSGDSDQDNTPEPEPQPQPEEPEEETPTPSEPEPEEPIVPQVPEDFQGDPLFQQGFQNNLSLINLPQIWQQDFHNNPGERIVVAVIDTGVAINHPDLAGNIWVNPNEIPGNNRDDDLSSALWPMVDDIHGWNFADWNDNIEDRQGHGTHVAGTIAARTGNDSGMAAFSPNNQIEIMVLKVFSDFSEGAFISDIITAVNYATEKGAHVINMSLGGPVAVSFFEEVLREAHRRNIVLVAAAGNDNSSIPFFPAAFEQVLSVGATDDFNNRASFSNFGSFVDVAAPGDGIASLGIPEGFVRLSGTSMASPHVAGLAALLRKANPNFDNLTIEGIIKATTNGSRVVGSGRIDALQAIRVTPAFVSQASAQASSSNQNFSESLSDILTSSRQSRFEQNTQQNSVEYINV